jgi:hypothetical protein
VRLLALGGRGISLEHFEGGLMQVEADVAVEYGEDCDFEEDHEAEGSEGDCYPLEFVFPGEGQPDCDADVARGVDDDGEEEADEDGIVLLAHAVVGEGAVVVELLGASLAGVAVVTAGSDL